MTTRRSFFKKVGQWLGALAVLVPFVSKANAKPSRTTVEPFIIIHKRVVYGLPFPLHPTQVKIFKDQSQVILVHGGLMSGKKTACLTKLINHCRQEQDALALIVAPSYRCLKEGLLYDLEMILKAWVGLEFTPKDRVLYIKNIHGGHSKIMLVSIPYGYLIERRIKCIAPSFIYVHDIVDLDGPEYFREFACNLGRRRGIKGPQQYIASCVPPEPRKDGKPHWVYQAFFTEGYADAIYHIPFEENHAHNEEYHQRLLQIFRNGPEKTTNIHGEWV